MHSCCSRRFAPQQHTVSPCECRAILSPCQPCGTPVAASGGDTSSLRCGGAARLAGGAASVSIGKLVVGQQRYYERQVAQGGDDYYSGRGEAPGGGRAPGRGRWGSKGGSRAELFNAMIGGADPTDPSARLRDWRAPKVAALDLTFSAPKSVSVLFAIADEPVAGELVRGA